MWSIQRLSQSIRSNQFPRMTIDQILEAADSGEAVAQYVLGLLSQNGLGFEQDNARAIEWFEKAAAKGFSPAKHSLGLLRGGSGRFRFKEAGRHKLEYGPGYFDGDSALSFGLCLESATSGFAPAQHLLSHYYDVGYGTAVNLQSAFEWALRAAESGYAVAARDVALMFQQGRGTPVSINQALLWYKAASKLGDGLSAWVVASIYLYGLGVSENVAVGLEWLEKAADLQCADAHEELAEAYREGLHGLTPDPEKAKRHAQLARQIETKGIGRGWQSARDELAGVIGLSEKD